MVSMFVMAEEGAFRQGRGSRGIKEKGHIAALARPDQDIEEGGFFFIQLLPPLQDILQAYQERVIVPRKPLGSSQIAF